MRLRRGWSRLRLAGGNNLLAVGGRPLARISCMQRLAPFNRGVTARFSTDETYPPHTLLPLAALSPTMEMGGIAQWVKNEGDMINAGDVVVEIETDKATVEYEAQDEAFLAKILVPAGTTDLPVGAPLAVLVDSEEDAGKFEGFVLEQDASSPSSPADPVSETHSHGDATPQAHLVGSAEVGGRRSHLTRFRHGDRKAINSLLGLGDSVPAAGVSVAAEGAENESVAGDVSGRGHTDIPLSAMRKVIASRLTESKATIPHYYTRMDCSLDALLSHRSSLKSMGIKVSVNDFIILAAALALRDVPEANAFWDEHTKAIVSNDSVDVSVAVATDGGLITPIVKDADSIGLDAVNKSVADLAARARKGKLAPEEYQGGTFTISNLGMFGIKEFTAVINPPQACILAVGGGTPHPVACENDTALRKETKMTVSLSADRRVVDEHVAAQFLQVFRAYCENPNLLSC